MTTLFDAHRPKAWVAQEPSTELFEETSDKTTGTVQTRKLASQHDVVHDKMYWTHINQTNATSTPGAAESVEQVFKIAPNDVEGEIVTIKLKQVITASASSVMFPQNMITGVYYNLPGGVQTPAVDGLLVATESIMNVNTEDLTVNAGALGFGADFVGTTCNTESTVLIDVTGPVRAMKLWPKFLNQPIELRFKYRPIASFMDTATQTISSITSTMIIQSRLTDAEEQKIIAKAYHDGFQATALVPYPAITATVAGTTELNLDMDLTGNCAFLVAMIADVSGDVQENALDFSGLTKYRIIDAAGNSIFFRNGSQYVSVNEHWARDAEMFDGVGLFKKNILILNTGCNNIVDTLQDGTYRGGYNFEGNERLQITSSDSSADYLYLFPFKYEVFLIKNGQFVRREDLK